MLYQSSAVFPMGEHSNKTYYNLKANKNNNHFQIYTDIVVWLNEIGK